MGLNPKQMPSSASAPAATSQKPAESKPMTELLNKMGKGSLQGVASFFDKYGMQTSAGSPSPFSSSFQPQGDFSKASESAKAIKGNTGAETNVDLGMRGSGKGVIKTTVIGGLSNMMDKAYSAGLRTSDQFRTAFPELMGTLQGEIGKTFKDPNFQAAYLSGKGNMKDVAAQAFQDLVNEKMKMEKGAGASAPAQGSATMEKKVMLKVPKK